MSLPETILAELRTKDYPRYQRLERNFVRYRCLRDFWFFIEFLLRNPVLYEKLHRELVDFTSTWGERLKKLVLLPRGHVKSNIITVAYTLWCILLDQDARILIASHKDKDAKKFLRTIKMHILDPRFQFYFPEIRPAKAKGKDAVWNEGQILVVRGTTATENTVEISSISSQVTGRHYTGMIGDDLVTPNNVATDDQRYKTQEMHELAQSLLDPGGWEIVCGTRYHHTDEYGRILQEDATANQYDKMIMPALFDISVIHQYIGGEITWKREHDFDHLLYPTRYTLAPRDYVSPDRDTIKARKSLVALYKNVGPKTFANQYMMEPFDPATKLMHDGMLKEWDGVPEDCEIVYYRACDLSSPTESRFEKSYTAILTVAVTDVCDIILTDIFWGNFPGHKIIDELMEGQIRHAGRVPRYVTMEQGPYERSIRPFLFRAMREREIRVPMRCMTGQQHQRAKAEHIEGIIPWLNAGKVGYVKGCRHIAILKEEMNKYPSFDRKDCLDSLAQIPLLCFRRGSERFLQEMKELPPEKTEREKLYEELNSPTVRFADFKQQLIGGSRRRLGADKVMKI